MTCPECGSKTRVIDTGVCVDCIYRKRRCLICKSVFYTIEIDYKDSKEATKTIYELKKEKIKESRNTDVY